MLIGLSGCATTPTVPSVDGRAIVDVTSGEALTRNAAIRKLRRYRHIYVGERHASPPHHAVQLEVLQALYAAGASVAVGVEWLPAELQPAIDDWLSGRIEESVFLKRIDWAHTWGHDWNAYAPILRWARGVGVPVWGLNAPRGLARAVGRRGPEGLDDALRAKLPPLNTANAPHREFFEAMMAAVARHHGGHHGGHGQASSHRRRDGGRTMMDRYYLAQLVRDEAMSINLHKRLQEPEGQHRTVVVLAGLGHVDHGHGVPLRAERLLDEPFAIVLPIASGTLDDYAGLLGRTGWPDKRADIIWEAAGPATLATR